VIVRAASLAVVPEALIFIEAIDRTRIRVPIVEVPDIVGYVNRWRGVFRWLAHDKFRIQKIPRQMCCPPGNLDPLAFIAKECD
jgi:hypothetical protein